MTPREVNALIVQRWTDEHTVTAIMIQLVCLGAGMTPVEILKVIRAYVDCQSENVSLGRK